MKGEKDERNEGRTKKNVEGRKEGRKLMVDRRHALSFLLPCALSFFPVSRLPRFL
jgi:hypothetical protein